MVYFCPLNASDADVVMLVAIDSHGSKSLLGMSAFDASKNTMKSKWRKIGIASNKENTQTAATVMAKDKRQFRAYILIVK